MQKFLITAVLLALSGICDAQIPSISPNGVVNGASLQYAPETGNSIAPGSLATIFGENFAPDIVTADSPPFPTELGGVRVRFLPKYDGDWPPGGIEAPIYYVRCEVLAEDGGQRT